jgi:hypothetical protein
MKNLSYLVVLMFSVVLMSTTSCSKKDEVVAPVTPVDNSMITLTELQGVWNFHSFQVSATSTELLTHKDVMAVSGLVGKDNVMISLNFTSISGYSNWVVITDPYAQTQVSNISGAYILKNNVITVNNSCTLKVINYNTTTKTLKLQLFTSRNNSGDPIGGFYNVIKQ